ncbi:MAG: hypothetical protein R3C56_42420 [Pirellulaceae bacterium]
MPNDGEPVANATAILEQRRPLNRPWEYAMTQSYVDGIESLQSSLDTLQVFELNGVPLKKDEIVNRLVDTHRAVLVDGRIDPFYYSFLKPDVLLVADQGWTKPLLELRDKPPTVMRRQIATRGQE